VGLSGRTKLCIVEDFSINRICNLASEKPTHKTLTLVVIRALTSNCLFVIVTFANLVKKSTTESRVWV